MNSWTESDSQLYQALAAIAVPDRAEQMATLLTLLPLSPAQPGHVVELGCGEGRLSQAVLSAFPRATLRALDGSAEMRACTTARLAPFGARAQVAPLDLAADNWWPLVDDADAVLSSLTIHHLDGPRKQRLFVAMAARLEPHGALLIADLVEPRRPEAAEVFAAGWDEAARRQASARSDSPRAFDQFVNTQWNVFRYPDPVDMPSPLFDQLQWLRTAGFASVDCYWLRAGHAVYGGYRSAQRSCGPPLAFASAMRIAADCEA